MCTIWSAWKWLVAADARVEKGTRLRLYRLIDLSRRSSCSRLSTACEYSLDFRHVNYGLLSLASDQTVLKTLSNAACRGAPIFRWADVAPQSASVQDRPRPAWATDAAARALVQVCQLRVLAPAGNLCHQRQHQGRALDEISRLVVACCPCALRHRMEQ